MKRILRNISIALLCGVLVAPVATAQGRGDRSHGGRTERTTHNNHGGSHQNTPNRQPSRSPGNNGAGRPSVGNGNHGNNNRPTFGTGNHNNNRPSIGNNNHENNNRPNVGNVNQNNNRPSIGNNNHGNNNRPNIGNGNHNNRPENNGFRPVNNGNNRPSVNPGNNRPGHNQPNVNPGHNRPNVNPGHNRPGHNPGFQIGGNNHGNFRPGANHHGPRPVVVQPPYRPFRPVMHRPHYRPMPPRGWRPARPLPLIRGILGLTFGTAINLSLDYLFNNGYTVDGYTNDVVYLRNVPALNYIWTDAALYYGNTGLDASSFYYSTPGYDLARYNNVYNSLVATYGAPVSINNTVNAMSATWFGGNNGYITLSFGANTLGTGLRYLTTLTFGM